MCLILGESNKVMNRELLSIHQSIVKGKKAVGLPV